MAGIDLRCGQVDVALSILIKAVLWLRFAARRIFDTRIKLCAIQSMSPVPQKTIRARRMVRNSPEARAHPRVRKSLGVATRFEGRDGRVALIDALRDQEVIEHDEALASAIAEVVSIMILSIGKNLIKQDGDDNDLFFRVPQMYM